MPSRFLSIGVVLEDLTELSAGLTYLQQLMELEGAQRAAAGRELRTVSGCAATVDAEIVRVTRLLNRRVENTRSLLASLPSDPVIYTGDASTEQVIRSLEHSFELLDSLDHPSDLIEPAPAGDQETEPRPGQDRQLRIPVAVVPVDGDGN